MFLITNFYNADGVVADFDDEGGVTAELDGNKITVYADNGAVLGRALMELDHNRIVWRLFRGKRGKEIGVATHIRFSV